MLKKIFIPLLTSTYVLCPLLDGAFQARYQTDIDVYGGYTAVKSEDTVFAQPHSRVVSRLNWTADNVWVMGGSGKISFPSSQAYVALDGWSKVYSGDGKMVDRDYLNRDDPSQRTDISVHPRTKLKTAFAIDFEVGKDFRTDSRNTSPWTFGYLVGVKYVQLTWEAFGGKYSYDLGRITGTFPSGIKVIRFSQQMTIPYLGGQMAWQCNPQWKCRAFGKYSGLGYIECHDDHLLWPKYFTSVHHRANYWMFGAEAIWRYSRKLSVHIKYSYDHLNQAVGDTTVRDENGKDTYKNASGIKYSLQVLTAGLLYRF